MVIHLGEISMLCCLCSVGKLDLIIFNFERGDIVNLSNADTEVIQQHEEFWHTEAKENAWDEQFAV